MVLLQHLPGVGMGLLHPGDQIRRVERQLAVVGRGGAFFVNPAVAAEVLADLLLEGALVVQGHQHVRSSLSATATPTGRQPLEMDMGFTANLRGFQPRGRCSRGL